jgi:hypothetical protein
MRIVRRTVSAAGRRDREPLRRINGMRRVVCCALCDARQRDWMFNDIPQAMQGGGLIRLMVPDGRGGDAGAQAARLGTDDGVRTDAPGCGANLGMPAVWRILLGCNSVFRDGRHGIAP